jgi:hypothetical protein
LRDFVDVIIGGDLFEKEESGTALSGTGLIKVSVPESQTRRCRRLVTSKAYIFVGFPEVCDHKLRDLYQSALLGMSVVGLRRRAP